MSQIVLIPQVDFKGEQGFIHYIYIYFYINRYIEGQIQINIEFVD